MRMLVGYASRFGSTRDIANRIAYRVFAGVTDLDHWPAWGRLLFKALGGHDGDNRQWPDIDAWAGEIAHDLQTPDRAPSRGD